MVRHERPATGAVLFELKLHDPVKRAVSGGRLGARRGTDYRTANSAVEIHETVISAPLHERDLLWQSRTRLM